MLAIWNWWVFVPVWLICTTVVQVSREEVGAVDIGRSDSNGYMGQDAPVITSMIVGAGIAAAITLALAGMLMSD